MTNERMIEIIKRKTSIPLDGESWDEINEAYDMAIKTLEDRPIANWKDHRWCSNCGCGIPTDVYGTSITEEEAHFCVECGARMGVENE